MLADAANRRVPAHRALAGDLGLFALFWGGFFVIVMMSVGGKGVCVLCDVMCVCVCV